MDCLSILTNNIVWMDIDGFRLKTRLFVMASDNVGSILFSKAHG